MKDKNAAVLSIETSCDETSAAVIENGRKVLSNIISSQIALHQRYGGVVPEIASRKHIENVMPVVRETLRQAEIGLKDVAAVGVTYGPGLVGALLVGVAAAKSLAYAADKPLIGVNHLEGHIFANFISNPDLEPPFLTLIVSGGHTSLVYVAGYNEFELLGQTRDDAAGEAFDKVARIMKLSYPGGPEIDKLAKCGNNNAIIFPRAKLGDNNFDFSFSGLKSAVINYMHNAVQRAEKIELGDIAASFQEAVVDALIAKTILAARKYKVETIALAGGVAANSRLQEKLRCAAKLDNIELVYPPAVLCTDNAAMIGCRAFYKYKAGLFADYCLNALPNLKIGES